MKTIVLNERSKDKLLHIEAPGCIINIQAGLMDTRGHRVTSIEILANGTRYAGEHPWFILDDINHKQSAANVRIIQYDSADFTAGSET